MRKLHLFLGMVLVSTVVFSQDKPNKNQPKDSLKTEVVNVITSYSPKVTDAFKIKRNPDIRFNRNRTKEKMTYGINSVPVASTFVPKEGSIKNIDLGKRERLYPNYLALGFGNNSTPFVEGFIHQYTRFQSEYGAYIKYTSSSDPVQNTVLNSDFSNFETRLFYKDEARYFDWDVGLDVELNSYNYYGLPNYIDYTSTTINAISPEQNHNYVALKGGIVLENSYIQKTNAKLSYFTDNFSSSEYGIEILPQLNIPLYAIGNNLEDLQLDVSLAYLGGSFAKSYQEENKLNYGFFTAKVHPKYDLKYNKFKIHLGTKLVFSQDVENSLSHFFIYPDVQISYPVIKDYANIYVGANGDLTTNSYKSFTDENPFVSPTLFLTQTNEKYNVFGGFNGKIGQNISYNTRVSYADEQDKPFFISNNSKSNGSNTELNGISLLGYEYGNSFNVVYDDVTTLRFFGELEYEISKNLTIGGNAEYNSYTMTNQLQPWNLPKLSGEVFAKYKTDNWYAGINFFGQTARYDVRYAGVYPSTFSQYGLERIYDVNLNGGYHINDMLSVFLKLNNVLNNEYPRYNNFNVRGFQALAGIAWKFDF